VKSASRWFALLLFMVVVGCGPQIRSERQQLADLQQNLAQVEMSLASAMDPDKIDQWRRVQHNLEEVIQLKEDRIRGLKDDQWVSVETWLGRGSDILETILGFLAIGGLGLRRP